ncbi:hypothetical protein BDN70DRAFT_883492 [Pholiota conissans]|uniref:Uncharacterized protein n=1 Tax=Pholiota conissans TaxID=109636 RepID=A0A9P6CXI3_9AGAR|nr:hypothetical protein BDN70DRAFT_883492 [Pholiota conissans]
MTSPYRLDGPQNKESNFSATRSSVSVDPTPTPVLPNILEPQITPSPTNCPPNKLVVQLSTTIVIPDFNTFYAPASIEAFVPIYYTLPDGSLLTEPFNSDLRDANVGLLIMGALTMVFARNIFVSGDYIRRGKVKKKMLFYVLFLSQILAPVSLAPIILTYFSQKISCNFVVILSCVCGATSLALLITVILGVKVYKCLNNARFIPVVLGLFQLGSAAVVVIDIIKTRGVQRLTGSCIRTDDLRFTRYFVILQFSESLFICCCFLYVCWKSRGSPAARGRISIELSMDDLPIEFPAEPVDNSQSARRGWWDYVPSNHEITKVDSEAHNIKHTGTVKGIMQKIKKPTLVEKSKGLNSSQKNSAMTQETQNAQARPNSLASSSTSKLSRLVPRMELFQQVMKDELLYTTFITFNCVIVAVLVMVGVNVKNGLSVTGWIALNWCIISLLAIHSFGRVVRRHERDALLHHPVTCTAIARAANELVDREGRKAQLEQRSASRFPAATTTRSIRIATESTNDCMDPFADTQPLAPNRASNLGPDYQDTSSLLSIPRSDLTNDGFPTLRVPQRLDMLDFLTSPNEQDFPTSNPATPTVSSSRYNNARRKEFSGSWLISSGSQSLYSEKGEEQRTSRGVPT